MRRNTLTRSIIGIAAQPGCAAFAAATARSTSAGEQRVISFRTSPENGERTSNVPPSPSTHLPPISARRGRTGVLTSMAISVSSGLVRSEGTSAALSEQPGVGLPPRPRECT